MRRKSSGRFNAREFFFGLTGRHSDRSYLILRGGDVRSKIIGSGKMDRDKSISVMDVDGVPHTVLLCRNRFIRSINRAHTVFQAYGMLRQMLADNDIRELFYELWRMNHNLRSARENERDYNEFSREENRRRKCNDYV